MISAAVQTSLGPKILQQLEKLLRCSDAARGWMEDVCSLGGKTALCPNVRCRLGHDMELISNHPIALHSLHVTPQLAHLLSQHIGLGCLVHSARPGAAQMKELAPVKQTGTVIN